MSVAQAFLSGSIEGRYRRWSSCIVECTDSSKVSRREHYESCLNVVSLKRQRPNTALALRRIDVCSNDGSLDHHLEAVSGPQTSELIGMSQLRKINSVKTSIPAVAGLL